MNDTDVSIDEQIRSFAASVRGHLDDLPDEELDDILGGLSADLAEQAADNDGVLDLGDPAAYAEELRSAAGIPPRGDSPKRPPLRERFLVWRAGVAANIRRSAVGAWVLDLLVALRPVWWVLRGFALFFFIKVLVANLPPWPYVPYFDQTMPASPLEWLLLAAATMVSIQWGRGLWLPKNPLRHLRTIVSVIAVILLPFAVGSSLTPRIEYIETGGYQPQGLLLDGVQINNIFAYDADGNPIERVQLFTGKGTPIDLYGGAKDTPYGVHDDSETATFPFQDYRGQQIWNIYPLDEASFETGPPERKAAERPAPPFLRAPSIESLTPSPTPDPSPEPTATPLP